MGWIRDLGIRKNSSWIQGSKKHRIPDPDQQHCHKLKQKLIFYIKKVSKISKHGGIRILILCRRYTSGKIRRIYADPYRHHYWVFSQNLTIQIMSTLKKQILRPTLSDDDRIVGKMIGRERKVSHLWNNTVHRNQSSQNTSFHVIKVFQDHQVIQLSWTSELTLWISRTW